ncbi:MAG: hypothetical protein ACYCQJ_03970 [Nitrososphaerales archaeon]
MSQTKNTKSAIANRIESISLSDDASLFDLSFKGAVTPDFYPLTGTLRTDVVMNCLDPHGEGANSRIFKQLDPFGYFSALDGSRENPLCHFSGIHLASSLHEVCWNAFLIFSRKDLDRIRHLAKSA